MSLSNSEFLNKIEAFYRGERIGNALLVGFGLIAAIVVSILFYFRQGHLSLGLFISTIPFAGFFVFGGAFRFIRTFRMLKLALEAQDDPKYFEVERSTLMRRLSNFPRKRQFSSIGLALGLILSVVFLFLEANDIVLGSCIGLIIMSSILLIYDLFSQFRIEEYLHFVKKKFH